MILSAQAQERDPERALRDQASRVLPRQGRPENWGADGRAVFHASHVTKERIL